MEEICLMGSFYLERLKPVRCRSCQRMFVIVEVHRVPEESGEHHYAATLDDAGNSEHLFCPYCGTNLGILHQPVGR